jgi:hypothetical protein
MTFLEALQSHKGGLILLKSELFWYSGRGWDGITGRVCLLMDAVLTYDAAALLGPLPAGTTRAADPDAPAVCLLIDGRPHWIWVGADDLELL